MEKIIQIVTTLLITVLLPTLIGGVLTDPTSALEFFGAWFIGAVIMFMFVTVVFFSILIID